MVVLKVWGLKCEIIRSVDKKRTRVYIRATKGGVRVTLGNDVLLGAVSDEWAADALVRVTINDDPYRLPLDQMDATIVGQRTCFRVFNDQIVPL